MNQSNSFEKKYGIKEDEKVKSFHKSRRMFCIIDNTLHIAKPNLPYSHATWFEKEGWMTAKNDHLMQIAPRGIINTHGNIYFYVGYDFQINNKIEKKFFPFLKQLVNTLHIATTANVYGGLIKQASGGQWPPKKDYGKIKELL